MRVLLHTLLFLCLICPGLAIGQTRGAGVEKQGIVYFKEHSWHAQLHAHGWGFGYQWGKIISYHKTKFRQVDFVTMHHAKEFNTQYEYQSPGLGSAKSYIYGKQNWAYLIRLTQGEKHFLSDKKNGSRNLALGWTWQAGANIAILRPYYLILKRDSDIDGSSYLSVERYTESNADYFLNPEKIYSSISYFREWNHFTFIPGLSADLALHLDWGAFDQYITAFSAGLRADLYYRKVPILATGLNSPYFINGYLKVELGSRK